MSFLRNRTVIGVFCILLSVLICFGLTPLFNRAVSQKVEIVRVTQPIRAGEQITDDTDALPPTSSSQQDEVVVDPDSSNPTTDPDASSDISEDDLTINPQTSPNDTGTNAGNGAISSGTEQTIQADPEVPEKPDEETLTDPSQKPDGTPVEGTPTPEDHDNYQPPQQPSTNTGGGLPGFENVPNAGGNQGGTIDSDGDINKQVGTMG